MISATRRALYGIRDTCGDDVVGCRRRRRGQGRRRKREARRKVRLLALVLVVVVVGVALVLVRICSAVRRGIPSVVTTAATTTTVGGEGETGMSTISVAAYGGEAWDRRPGDEGRALQDETTNAAAGCTDNSFSEGGWGQVVLLVIAILFTFNGLAIVCDEFFQASLEKISEVLELTPDVAGATFLAAGSSAPELFTSIADVFGPSNSIGVGTIVGSAMFNVLVIVALSAAVAARSGSSAKIDRRVVARDVTFYTGSIIILVASARDGLIQWWEALIMVSGYGLYIVFMIFNSKILAMFSAPRGTILPTTGGLELESLRDVSETMKQDAVEASQPLAATADRDGEAGRRSSNQGLTGGTQGYGGERDGGEAGEGNAGGEANQRRGSYPRGRRASRSLRVSHLKERRSSQEGNYGPEIVAQAATSAAVAAVATVSKAPTARTSWDGEAGAGGSVHDTEAVKGKAHVDGGGEAEEYMDDQLAWPEGWVERFLFVFGLPFLVGLSLTVPDCSRPQYEKYYVVTFVMSITWISIISSYMVELATGAACILGVSAIVMGVLVLAVGTSVPDMIGSMIAAKNGEASMAIANAIGSNVFNILLGLGGPWFVSTLASGVPTPVDKDGATTALIILLCAVFIFVLSLVLSRWSMNKNLAIALLVTYISYVIYTITAEALK